MPPPLTIVQAPRHVRTAILYLFAYVDIFGFWRADVLHGVLACLVPGTGLVIDQAFLSQTTAHTAMPALMVVASLWAPARINRPLNAVASVLYALSVASSSHQRNLGLPPDREHRRGPAPAHHRHARLHGQSRCRIKERSWLGGICLGIVAYGDFHVD